MPTTANVAIRLTMQGAGRTRQLLKSVQSQTKALYNTIGKGAVFANQASQLLAGLGRGTANVLSPFVLANAEMERSEVILGNLLGTSDKAKAKIAELLEFSRKTPFQIQELIETYRLLEVFAQGSNYSDTNIVEILGDAAAGTQKSLEEITQTVNRLFTDTSNSILSGQAAAAEPLRRLLELGLLNAEQKSNLSKLVKDAADGNATLEDVMRTAFAGLRDNFDNNAVEQSETFLGSISTIKDQIGILQREAGLDIFGKTKEDLITLKNQLDALISSGDQVELLAPVQAELGAFYKSLRDNTFIGLTLDEIIAASDQGQLKELLNGEIASTVEFFIGGAVQALAPVGAFLLEQLARAGVALAQSAIDLLISSSGELGRSLAEGAVNYLRAEGGVLGRLLLPEGSSSSPSQNQVDQGESFGNAFEKFADLLRNTTVDAELIYDLSPIRFLADPFSALDDFAKQLASGEANLLPDLKRDLIEGLSSQLDLLRSIIGIGPVIQPEPTLPSTDGLSVEGLSNLPNLLAQQIGDIQLAIAPGASLPPVTAELPSDFLRQLTTSAVDQANASSSSSSANINFGDLDIPPLSQELANTTTEAASLADQLANSVDLISDLNALIAQVNTTASSVF